ncbi:MAG: peptidyl-prolyl cis-trans isomerase [Labilithrix sp.]|nr:peptidyl-prolyl cis-trans isomerase [Labilithrix sp.]MCW5816611.1 peptidyl-prolyl cis-trans isomerase [Labilithrix sp.]
MIRSAVPAVTLASFLFACGANPGATTTVTGNSEANVAARATEPRTTDPTGAAPTRESQPNPIGALGGGGGAPSGPPAPAFRTTGESSPASGAQDPEPAAAPTQPPPKRIGARHVLVQWMGAQGAPTSVVRSRDQAQAVAEEVLRKARAKADFARLVVDYSDEPNAGARGGSLGVFGHGKMVPEFEEAAFKLQVGQISGIVESPFGFHIIQRTE